jgi:hypothetical protein
VGLDGLQEPQRRTSRSGESRQQARESEPSFADDTFLTEAEEERYYRSLLEEGTHPQRVLARKALGRPPPRRGAPPPPAEMYERNLWVGAHDQEVYRRLASVYRRLQRDDLVEQIVVQMHGLQGPPPPIRGPRPRQAVSASESGVGELARRWLERLLDLLEPGGAPLRTAAGWLALACVFAAGAAFVFTLVSPVLGSGGPRPATDESPGSADESPGSAIDAAPAAPAGGPVAVDSQPSGTDTASSRAQPGAASKPVVGQFLSGGLGVPREEWEGAHGRPERGDLFVEYEGGRFIIGYSDGLVWYIERTWGPREVVSLEAARGASRELMPADARLSRTDNPSDDQVFDVHASDSLMPRFRPTAWNGGRPGTFTVRYRVRAGSGQVTAMQFRLGDGPSQ